jgi:hypothetical protein
MTGPAWNTFFTNLGTADNSVAQQIVSIIDSGGAFTCDPSIAVAKGWVINR